MILIHIIFYSFPGCPPHALLYRHTDLGPWIRSHSGGERFADCGCCAGLYQRRLHTCQQVWKYVMINRTYKLIMNIIILIYVVPCSLLSLPGSFYPRIIWLPICHLWQVIWWNFPDPQFAIIIYYHIIISNRFMFLFDIVRKLRCRIFQLM